MCQTFGGSSALDGQLVQHCGPARLVHLSQCGSRQFSLLVRTRMGSGCAALQAMRSTTSIVEERTVIRSLACAPRVPPLLPPFP